MRARLSYPRLRSDRSGGRVLVRLLVAVGMLLLLLAGLAYLGWRTEAGARLAWQAAQRFAPGQLSGELSGGTLANGLRLRAVRYQDAQRTIAADSIDAAWAVNFSPPTLRIATLHIGTVDLQQQPAPSEPASMPTSLRLPLALELRDAQLRELILRQAGSEDATRLRDIRLQATTDGVSHNLQLQQIDTPFGRLQGVLGLNGDAPFPLDGSLGFSGRVQEQDFRANARLSGSLQALHVEASAASGELDGRATIDATPFAQVPLQRALISVEDFDPQAFNPEWPRAQLDLRATLQPQGVAAELSNLIVAGPVELTNARPGSLDAGLLPLASARAEVRLDSRKQQLDGLVVRLAGGGLFEGGGELRSGADGEFRLRAQALDLNAVHRSLRKTRLSGPIDVALKGSEQTISLELGDANLEAEAEALLSPTQIRIPVARLQAGNARLDLQGTLERNGDGAFAASGKLQDFNPARFAALAQPAGRGKRNQIPQARINMDFEAEGMLQPELRGELRFDIDDSSYAGLPLEGGGTLKAAGKRLLPSELALQIAGNTVDLAGSFGAPGDRVKFDIDAPALDRLGFGLGGRLLLKGDAAGTVKRPVINARYSGERLSFGPHRLATVEGEAGMQGLPGSDPAARVDLDLNATGVRSAEIALDTLSADIDGSYASHTLRLDARGQLRGQPLEASLGASGRLRETPQGLAWDGVVNTLENRARPRVALTTPLQLAAAPGRITLGNGRLTIEQAALELQSLQLEGGRIRSAGRFSALHVGQMLALQQQFTGNKPPLATDLVLDGSWDFTLADTGSGYLLVERRSGDVGIPSAAGERKLGLNALRLRADLRGDTIVLDARTAAARIGSLQADGDMRLQQIEGRLAPGPESALALRLRAEVPRLQSIAAFAGPRIALDGNVRTVVTIGGTLAEPRISGRVDGENLALTLYDQGVRLSDGIARLEIEDNLVRLQEVIFHGGEGTLRATGSIGIGAAPDRLDVQITADRLQLLASPTGRLTVSGSASAAQAGGQAQVTGKFTVDRALFSLPEKTAPSLDDDVVVIRRDRPQQEQTGAGEGRAPLLSPHVDVVVDLGRNFRFEGSGAELRLAGQLNVQSTPGEAPQAYGTVRVAEGTYEAFGAELEIERGLINFQGPLANPNLNILAMRREQEVEAGVQISGTVRQPRVQLVSEPNVSDEEKLSWLIFGRGGGGGEQGQASAAAQGAALGLLNKFGGSRVAKGLGLDELSIGSSEFGMEGSQVVNIGKEITDRLTLGYEQSLAGAESVLRLSYQLSRSWTVVLRGGTVTGLDVFYNKRFDGDGRPRPGRS